MNNENNAMIMEGIDEATEMCENNTMSTGAAMLVGSLLTLATIAVVKKVREVMAIRKAQKEQADIQNDSPIIDITDEVNNINKTENDE